MKDIIKQFEFHSLNGESLWTGIIPVGKEKAELQIEAPASGPSDAQSDILADLIANHSAHRARVFKSLSALLQSQGIDPQKIYADRMSVSITCISSTEKKTRIVMVGDMKLKGFLARSYLFQADLLESGEYSVSLIQ